MSAHAPSLPDRARAIPFFTLAKALLRRAPRSAPLGQNGPPEREALRFVHDVRPIFHASDVSALRFLERYGREMAVVSTTFLGLVGAVSPLATYLTEEILGDDSSGSQALRDFYDVFHHRLTSFVYRAHLRATPLAEVRLDASDRTSCRSLSAVGRSANAGAALSARASLALAPLLGRRPGSRAALEASLRLAFPMWTFHVEDFLLGLPTHGREGAPRMGASTIVTRRAKHPPFTGSPAEGVRIVVAGVAPTSGGDVLTEPQTRARLRALVASILGSSARVEIEVWLPPERQPRARLGAGGARLGRHALVLRANTPRQVRARFSLTGAGEDAAPVFLVSRR